MDERDRHAKGMEVRRAMLGNAHVDRTQANLMVALNREEELRLRLHLRAAANNGVTRDEIKEILLQTAIYCGVPAANSAFLMAQEVFKGMGAEQRKSLWNIH